MGGKPDMNENNVDEKRKILASMIDQSPIMSSKVNIESILVF